MKRIILSMLLIGAISLTACGAKNNGDVNTQAQETESQNITSEETETEERLKTTDFSNLPKVAEKVGFSFRALESLDADDDENNSFKFQNFSISTEKETEINGMKLDEPSYTIQLTYQKQGRYIAYVTIFPYSGDDIQPVLLSPNCYVKTEKLNDVDINLAEYILHLVPSDYELTDEDRKFIESGKGDFSCDGITVDDYNFKTLYWTQNGIYYGLDVREENYALEDICKIANDIMNAEIQ